LRFGDDPVVHDAPFLETQYGIVKRLHVIEEWVHQVKERAGKDVLTILDYGCGTGDHVTFPLARAGHGVLGIDIHESSVLEARRGTHCQTSLSGPPTLKTCWAQG